VSAFSCKKIAGAAASRQRQFCYVFVAEAQVTPLAGQFASQGTVLSDTNWIPLTYHDMKTRISSLVGVVLLFALMGTAPSGSSARNSGDVRPDISITTLPMTITQDFNTLPASGSVIWTNNSTLAGWYHARTGTGTTIVASDGSSTTGALYSFGTGTSIERALGSVGSGTAGGMFWGILLTNNTGATITTLAVTYTGEQWRNSAAAGACREHREPARDCPAPRA
jgi:hypothetical protein